MFKDHLATIISRTDLSESQMAEMMSEIFDGKTTDAQVGAMMAALATKGETVEELAGAARAMRKKAHRIQAAAMPVVDTCGTGGDGLKTFNISTTTAFVVAGAGVTVAKHGNRSVSSKCGSADVLERLGVKLDTDPEVVEEAVQEIGIGFLFAPLYHSAMRHAAKARMEVGLRSIFNMLGPLTNPAGANCQLLGVFAPQLTEMFAEALRLLGAKSAFVVHGHDGLDEISVCAPTRVSQLENDMVRTYDIYPEQYFGRLAAAGPDDRRRPRGECRHYPQDSGRRKGAQTGRGAAQYRRRAGRLPEGTGSAGRASPWPNRPSTTGAAMAKLEALVAYTRDNG
jgi:anthranilate phosphoribosyltransferase